MSEPRTAAGLPCSNCGEPMVAHCSRHVLPCCPHYPQHEAAAPAGQWNATRELRIEQGPVVISQTRTDPGDMGEPRVFASDGVTYVAVPDFDQWAAAAPARLVEARLREAMATRSEWMADEYRSLAAAYAHAGVTSEALGSGSPEPDPQGEEGA